MDPLQKKGIAEMVGLVWHFFGGGKDLRGHALFVSSSVLLAVAFIGALLLVLRSRGWRHWLLFVLYFWLVPLSMALGVWWLRPMVHPRYALMFSLPLFIGMSYTIITCFDGRTPAKLAGAFLAAALAATFALGLGIAYFDTGYYNDDVRGLARYLEPRSETNDLVVVHASDHAVGYYYDGSARITMVDPENAQAMASLGADLLGKERAFVGWPFGVPVGKVSQLPFLMETHGRLVDRRAFRGYSLETYELGEAPGSETLQLASADFEGVRLTGIFCQKETTADGAVCLALRWRLDQAVPQSYKAVVTLWDCEGRRLSATDMLLKNEWGLPTEHWTPGHESVDYYVVPIPIGTPPLSYRVTVGVYDAADLQRLSYLDEAGSSAGVDFLLGEVKVTGALGFERDPYGTRSTLELQVLAEPEIADGLALEGFAINDQPLRRMVSVTLRWRALRSDLPRYVPLLRFRQGDVIDTVVGSHLFEQQYPTSVWSQGEVVIEYRDVRYPADGRRATLEVETAGHAVALGEVAMEKGNAVFSVPLMQHSVGVQFGDFAELLGYDIDRLETRTDEKVGLTLYWRATSESPIVCSYTVFAHLLSQDGRLIGQHDGKPALGMRPTMSWVPGEIIADIHGMSFSESSYQGKAVIEVGLYESLTIKRVPMDNGRDHVILPTEIAVWPAQR